MRDCHFSLNLFVLLNMRVDGDNIKKHLNEICGEGVDGIQLTQHKILAAGFWRHGNKYLGPLKKLGFLGQINH